MIVDENSMHYSPSFSGKKLNPNTPLVLANPYASLYNPHNFNAMIAVPKAVKFNTILSIIP